MAAIRQFGGPIYLTGLDAGAERKPVERVSLSEGGQYNEAWLQNLLMQQPSLLPIGDIEPALTPAIPICRELHVPSGFIDNLYITPVGDLIVVETKLWRNPQARREVVGQILDYAKDLAAWSYEQLDRAVVAAASRDDGKTGPVSLFGIVGASGMAEIEEAQFVDAVSRNLRRGRFLLLIVGDGIQEGAEALAGFLQLHAGLHFTLAMVELAIFKLPTPDASYFVQPRLLLRTTNIDRGIVSMSDGRISIASPAMPADAVGAPRQTSITEEKFYEELAATRPGPAEALKAFVARVAELGVYTDFGKQSLILRWRPDQAHVWNLGAIQTDGKVWTELHHPQAAALGLLAKSQDYITRVAALVPDAYVKKTTATSWHIDKDNTYIRIDDLLAHADAWFVELKRYLDDVQSTLAMAS